MLLKVARERIKEAILISNCEAIRIVPRETLEVIIDGLEESVAIGMGSAATLGPTYRDRYESIKEFRDGSFGWSGFFDALGEAKESVGVLAVRGGGWRIILLLNESADSVIGSLVRPPIRADWPEGASAT
jgi:hypothetical protein